MARWVLHFLSKTEKQQQVEICSEHLHRYMIEDENMLKHILATEETWIRSFEPELKHQSAEWYTPNSPRLVKFRRSMNNPKMMIFAYDAPDGTTVNKEYYESYLWKILCPAISRKRPELLRVTPLILHDNATPHKAALVKAVFEEYHCEVLKHPSYSPDLSSPGYDLFRKLNEILRGIRYDDLNELYRAVNVVAWDINRCCLAMGVKELPRRWESMTESAGDYIEGM